MIITSTNSEALDCKLKSVKTLLHVFWASLFMDVVKIVLNKETKRSTKKLVCFKIKKIKNLCIILAKICIYIFYHEFNCPCYIGT